MTETTQETIFRKLSSAGFRPSYISSLLPEWWSTEASSPTAIAEMGLMLARALGVDYRSLIDGEAPVSFTDKRSKHKKVSTVSEDQLGPATSVAFSAARISAKSIDAPICQVPAPTELREYIIQSLGASSVSLKPLLVASWHIGVPVIFVSNFPDGLPKFDGMATIVEGRPVIIIGKNARYRAWLSFIVAHELGHIHSGHCVDGQSILDEDFNKEDGRDLDPEEEEADDFSLELLGGNVDIENFLSQGMSPGQLAEASMELQRQHQVDAGHALLRHAHATRDWQRCIASLKLLDIKGEAASEILQGMSQYLDLSMVSEGSKEFFQKVTGMNQG